MSFVGRPPLRSRGTPFHISRATFRDRLKWLMAVLSSTSRPALFRSALSAFCFSSMNARTSPSEGRRADAKGPEAGCVRVVGSGQHRLQSSLRIDRLDQNGSIEVEGPIAETHFPSIVAKAKTSWPKDQSRRLLAPLAAEKSNAPSLPGLQQFIGRCRKGHGRLHRGPMPASLPSSAQARPPSGRHRLATPEARCASQSR